MSRKKLITIIISSIITGFVVYMLIMSLITIHSINRLKYNSSYGDEVINEYLIIAFAQLSCVFACFLDIASVVHMIFSEKQEDKKNKQDTIKLLFYIILYFCFSVITIFFIKYNDVGGLHWLPPLIFVNSGNSLLIFLLEFLLPIKKKKTYNEK